ncbi:MULTISPECIES: NAD(P)-dependent oxidoreductase [unclassified Bradyrhizobium]|uniref:NAD-dependent epimerase/dehydratase family protein n=1 Tax=unclassified Bradyrhizobium TaxID=2631580 RepID=UPI001FF8882A|nr:MULTISPECIES: NAD(P)-dependent oxidoreductase [unclassified Bradyrhizobium]MCK1551517.1 NAD(P)-dependent oxidoreductase [Bradyrhizobium sp. 177]MCK1577664.1 NAD(P)-dependent oxidoreductase [Bradyrhizobium sp. 174]UPJ29883.1 NAD(P)-dependent oxidoreductase [Bradyrhizobium sp. CW1]
MKVLVTGSSGFIGQALVRRLRTEHCAVVGLDKAPAGTTEIVCDILDADRLTKALTSASPDAVVHLAARIDLDEKVNLSGYTANIEGVENLVEAVRQTPSVRRAIWTSSQLVCRVGYVPASETDYQADTLYGKSKVRTEEIVRSADGAGREWCLVRPTTVWGPGMSAHYQRFLRMIERGQYFHVGHAPLWKSYSYIDNITFQYWRLLDAPAEHIHRRTFYLADYTPIDLIAWCDAFQRNFGSRPIPHLSTGVARTLAFCGDAVNAIGLKRFPFNSFRLNNVLTEYQFDLAPTAAVCGPLPYDMEQGVSATVAWLHNVSAR